MFLVSVNPVKYSKGMWDAGYNFGMPKKFPKCPLEVYSGSDK